MLKPNSTYLNLKGSSSAYQISNIINPKARNLIITPNLSTAEILLEDLKFFCDQLTPILFPSWDTLPFESVSPQIEISAQRIFALSKLQCKANTFITNIQNLYQKHFPLELIEETKLNLVPGQELAIKELREKIKSLGYQKSSIVEFIGQYKSTELTLDIFPITHEDPVRIEFEGNIIKEIRNFDSTSQRSKAKIKEIEILIAKEAVAISNEDEKTIKSAVNALDLGPRTKEKLLQQIFEEGINFSGIEQITSNLVSFKSFFEQTSQDLNVYLVNSEQIFSELKKYKELVETRYNKLFSKHLIAQTENLYLDDQQLVNSLEQCKIHFLEPDSITEQNTEAIACPIRDNSDLTPRLNISNHDTNQLITLIKEFQNQDYTVFLTAESETRQERIKNLLNNDPSIKYTIHSKTFSDFDQSTFQEVHIVPKSLSQGFKEINNKFLIITEQEIFGKKSIRNTNQKLSVNLKKILGTLSLLDVDDFVVHEDYGIGIYQGLKNMTVNSYAGDFIQINYADSKLFLPVHNIGRIQKYTGTEGKQPVLDRLSSKKWIKTKAKVQKSINTLAGDLIKLYATRKQTKGWVVEQPGMLDMEFSDLFPYNETEDQLVAINDVFQDMTKGVLMDRLICGDVGFGKTEVAMRAAFKSAMNGKQVAILAPTTILVEQHYKNFKERFAPFPINLRALSRFYSNKENKLTVNQLAAGQIDIVIGTHKLLQSSIQFKDLGLLIIDEEHRFGVKQKETLKNLKSQLHVLTMTATPIPRTLYMSLSKIRDLSVINTPPTDRRSIKTHVGNYDEHLVRDAILKELQRQGQVFYVHNQVKDIALVTEELSELIPEANFRFAHGQMNEDELEKIMHDFQKHEFDVLVTTTIIESGIDLPNVNTLIIERADKFGLAQLYQLRGRVGRSNRQAYAYLLVPEIKKLSSDAKERLEALNNIDDLGQGFHLALRDLEIRGAGNLLGKEQSGNLFLVGYDLYTKILNDTILTMLGESDSLASSIDPDIKIPCEAYIPDFYIADISERLVLYQRLGKSTSDGEIEALMDEICDRYGQAPQELILYSKIMKIRALMRKLMLSKLEVKKDSLKIWFHEQHKIDIAALTKLSAKEPNQYKITNKSFNIMLTKEFEPNDIDLLSKIIRTNIC